MKPPTSLFGVPLALPSTVGTALILALEGAWRATYGHPIGPLGSDLRLMSRYFDPAIRGERLRNGLDSIENSCAGFPLFSEELLIDIGGDRCMPTPEGRVILDILRDRRVESETTIISPDDVAAAEHVLRTLYANWVRRKLDGAVALLAGTASPMLAPAAGVAIWLLVNRNVGPQRALRRPGDPESRRHLDEAVAKPVLEFANSLIPGKRRTEHFSLYGGYALTELRRRLSGSMSASIDELYIREGQDRRVIEFLGHDLSRRPTLKSANLASAFDLLVSEYRKYLPRLSSLNLAFERPAATMELRESLLAAFIASRVDA
jgi:hypothetical protein